MRGMKSIGQNKCAFCRKYILDPGSLLLSKVNLENLTNWCEIMMDMDSEDVDELIRAARVCRYCIWDAKFYYENTGGNENTVWWNTDDAMYKYYVANMIKPCEMKLHKLSNNQIHHWTKPEKKNFKCLVCSSMHETQYAMKRHMSSRHPDEKFFKCWLCKQLVPMPNGKQAHFDEFHSEEISTSMKTEKLKCQFCYRIFIGKYRKYKRSEHTKLAHAKIAVRCAWFGCCRYFHTHTAMEKHANEKHNNVLEREKFYCIFCGDEFLSAFNVRGHVRKKHKRVAHFCPHYNCGTHYKTKEEVQAHFKTVHEKAPNDDKITCTLCGKMISSIRVHYHMRLKHSTETFKCKKASCHEYFPNDVAATEHFNATHGSKNGNKIQFLSCSMCKFQSQWRHNLEGHISARHFPRTLKCPDCPKMFASKQHINEHARKAHIKRRKCPYCDLAPAIYNSHVVNTKCLKCSQPFKCYTLMKKHLLSCKLSFDCDFCKKTYKLESFLQNHLIAVHRELSKNRLTCHICGKLVKNKCRMKYHLKHVHSIKKQKEIY